MIMIGQKVIFNPIRDVNRFDAKRFVDYRVIGEIIYIHEDHNWFMVEYGNGYKVHTCFKFNDIGRGVSVVIAGVDLGVEMF